MGAAVESSPARTAGRSAGGARCNAPTRPRDIARATTLDTIMPPTAPFTDHPSATKPITANMRTIHRTAATADTQA